MGMGLKEATDRAIGMVENGEIPANKRNVAVVQMMGVRLFTGSLTREMRSELNAAVKAGELGHLPKDGRKPEAYFHKNARANALDACQAAERETERILRGVLACGILEDGAPIEDKMGNR